MSRKEGMKNVINIYKEIDRGCIRSIELIKGKKKKLPYLPLIYYIHILSLSLSLSFPTCTCTLTGGKKI